jgi:hypothetical protein
MKKNIITAALLMGFAFVCPLDAAEPTHPVDLEADWENQPILANRRPKDWSGNSKFPGGRFELIPTDTGSALEIYAEDPDGKTFHIYSRRDIPATPDAILRVKVVAKGTGSFSVSGYLYSSDGQNIGLEEGKLTNTADLTENEYSTFEYEILVPPARNKKPAPENVRVALVAENGSHLLVKSIAAAVSDEP